MFDVLKNGKHPIITDLPIDGIKASINQQINTA